MAPSCALNQTGTAQRKLVGHLRTQGLHLRIREEAAQIAIALWRASQKTDDWRNAPVLERGYVADHDLHFPNLAAEWHPHALPSTDGTMNPRTATMRPRIPRANPEVWPLRRFPAFCWRRGRNEFSTRRTASEVEVAPSRAEPHPSLISQTPGGKLYSANRDVSNHSSPHSPSQTLIMPSLKAPIQRRQYSPDDTPPCRLGGFLGDLWQGGK